MAFYYSDINLIHLYLEKKVNTNYQFNLQIQIVQENKIIHYENSRSIKILELEEKVDPFRIEIIETFFNLSNFVNNTKNVNLKVNITDLNNLSIKNPIKLVIKKFNSLQSSKNHSVLCSKLYYLKKDYIKYFEWWIKINKLNGFDKIVLFNNSLDSSFNNLFSKYKGFVEIIQYQCLPNFFIENNANKTYINFFEIKQLYNLDPLPYHIHFEFFSFNECLLMNRDKYKYVAIMDSDETIIPRKPYNYELKETFYQNNFSENEMNLSTYLNSITTDFKLPKETTFGFRWATYLNQKTVNILFDELSKLLLAINQTEAKNYQIVVEDLNDKDIRNETVHFNVLIENNDDFKYAKYLYDMHKKYVMPFLIENRKFLNEIPEPYNRFYYLCGQKSIPRYEFYKHIHDSSQASLVNTHFPRYKVNSHLLVPINYGHTSHFRTKYSGIYYWLKNMSIPIKELFFDFNYFNNYFKPILNKF